MVEAVTQPNTEMTYKKCSTCKRDIEEPKFRLHDVACARNNYLCKECGEVVAKADKEEHEREAHVPVSKNFIFL